eukprot:TRINITY_DN680_c0_g1_i1.p1 TRINITY_DN680_c0_g1~~TRINITY_DN680_c0_g1_i1.p1  ORF type:complete len:214 (-),score=20.50 TRINITY_DN680_c0_g1_i1:75-716(-)
MRSTLSAFKAAWHEAAHSWHARRSAQLHQLHNHWAPASKRDMHHMHHWGRWGNWGAQPGWGRHHWWKNWNSDFGQMYQHWREMMDDAYEKMGGRGEFGGQWMPHADLAPTMDGSGYEIVAELPGVSKDSVKIDIVDNVLTLRGEKKDLRLEGNGAKPASYFSERRFGSFVREFKLPEEVDRQSIKADFRDGILTIRMSKSGKTSSPAIQINID